MTQEKPECTFCPVSETGNTQAQCHPQLVKVEWVTFKCSLLFQVSKQLKVCLQMHLDFAPAEALKTMSLDSQGFLQHSRPPVGIIAKVSLGHSIPRLWEGKTLCSEKLSISSIMSPYLDSSILCLFQVGYPYEALMSDNWLVFP